MMMMVIIIEVSILFLRVKTGSENEIWILHFYLTSRIKCVLLRGDNKIWVT